MNASSGVPAGRPHPLGNLILARLREFYREPDAIFWVYVFPLILVIALGVAFRNRRVESFRVAVLEGGAAERVLDGLSRDPRFHAHRGDAARCRLDLRAGRVDLVVSAACGAPGGYEYSFDPTRPESVLARNAVNAALQREAGRLDPVPTVNREVDEPGGRYIDFLVPGLIGMGLMGGGLWGVGFAIVDMRIRKLLKRYLATPMKRSHFLVAVIASRILFTLPEVAATLLFARVLFGVRSEGGYLLIAVLVLLGSLEFSGIGLLVATRARTIETVSGLMNAVMLPMWIASGIFFSTERFPASVQPLIRLLPLTPLIRALRSVMLEGAALTALLPDLSIIAVWGVVTFFLALRWFRWN